MQSQYPIPSSPPVYQDPPGKVSGRRRLGLFELFSAGFSVLAVVLCGWLAVLLLVHGVTGQPLWLLNLLLFWAVTAYLALPRVHQLVSVLYVPDYFIGRTRTADGMLGDPINLAVDGSRADIHAAMTAAGWSLADELTLRSALGIIRSAVFKRSYAQAPVSGLYVFGHLQSFAYEQEVAGNASRRHHVRFWQVPEGWRLPGGEQVQWLAGATYDRAVGFSDFTGQVTHKIDANIDVERDYVVDTLRYADHQVGVRVIEHFSTAYHSRNGGGDAVHTDGNLPVLDVDGAAGRHPSAHLPVPRHRAAADRHLPPFALLATGVLFNLALVGAVLDLVLGARHDPLPLVAVGLLTLLWWLVADRRRWAWVGAMALLCLEAGRELVRLHLTGSSTGGESAVLTAGSMVLAVLAVSSESVRHWVGARRYEDGTPS